MRFTSIPTENCLVKPQTQSLKWRHLTWAARWAVLTIACLLCPSLSFSAPPQVAANGFTSMAVDADGNLFGWGDNGSGLLGRLDKAYAPDLIPQYAPFARAFSGLNRIFLIDPAGGLWGAGNNQFGQLGDGSFFLRRTGLVKLGENFSDLAVGGLHTLAIKSDGSLWSWGANDDGQLGDNQTNPRARPFALPLGKAASVAAGTSHSLAVLADGSLWAWGANQDGQLGDGTTVSRIQPVKIGDGFVQVAAGGDFSLARKSDGSVWSWGSNHDGQLGNGTTTSRTVPTAIAGNFKYLAAGEATTLALDANGTLFFWGRTYGNSATPMQTAPTRLAEDIQAVSAGARHLLAKKNDGSLYALGSNEFGALGVADETTSDTLELRKVANKPVAFAAGGDQSLLIDATGRAYVWGSNSEGQLAQGRDDRVSVPVLLATKVRKLALGSAVAYAIRDDGGLWAWGDNRDGRLGDGTTRARAVLTQLGDGFESVSTGNTQTFAIKTDGSLWAWGVNDFGQLGLGDEANRDRPTKVGDGYRAVAAGGEHTMALKTDGSLWLWGRNRYGQLGNGQFEDRFGPQAHSTPAKLGDGYVDIAAGAHHSLALKTDGSLWAWGWNEYGQIGDGSTVSRAVPVQVASNIAKLLSAGINNLVLGRDGKTYGWGYNGEPWRRYNLLLAGSEVFNSLRPMVVGGDWLAGSAASAHAVYLRKDGLAFSVGYQQFGQLGDGSFDDVRTQPTAVLAVGLNGLLDLMPGVAKQLQPGDVPPYFVKASRQGENARVSLGVQVRIPAANLPALGTARSATVSAHATGSYQMYVVASVPVASGGQTQWFSLQPPQAKSGANWAGITQPLAAYLQNISANDNFALEFDVLENLDTSALAGATLYLGYGLDQDEMLQNQRYRLFFMVPGP